MDAEIDTSKKRIQIKKRKNKKKKNFFFFGGTIP